MIFSTILLGALVAVVVFLLASGVWICIVSPVVYHRLGTPSRLAGAPDTLPLTREMGQAMLVVYAFILLVLGVAGVFYAIGYAADMVIA